MTTAPDPVAEAVRGAYDAQLRALLEADIPALDTLLTEDYAQEHMTGHQQTRADWLTDIASGAMTYHHVDVLDVDVDSTTSQPLLTARTRTTATIWGARGTWPLLVRIRFTHDGSTWRAASSAATTW